jgi:hypothetical protein
MWPDLVRGDLAVGDQVQRDVDHVILQAPTVQIASLAGVVERQGIRQEDLGDRQCLIGAVAAKRFQLVTEFVQERFPSRGRIDAEELGLLGRWGRVEQVLVVAVKTVLMAGRPIWSTCVTWSGCQVIGSSVLVQTPIFGLRPSSRLGTSSAIEKTFRLAKKSDPVNMKLFRKPIRSKKNGSLRKPA